MTKKALQKLNITDCVITVLIVGDQRIKTLNKKYFQKDFPTNVISFPYDRDPLEGDIVISLDTVEKEVEGAFLTDEEKIFFYIIHGLLHCLGHDHRDEESEMKMRELELELFREVAGKEVA